MKNKILVFTILLVMFLFPFSVFGAVSYSRDPSGFTITNPVSFDIGGVFDEYPSGVSWNISTTDDNWDSIWWDCIFTNNGNIEENLPLGTYLYVDLRIYDDDICVEQIASAELEANDENPIFEVIEGAPESGGVIILPESALASTTAYIGDLINSIGPFLWLIIGLPLGFWIINETIKFVSGKKIKVRK